ncbi:hypothetical protein [Streptomyces sp. NPDC004788]
MPADPFAVLNALLRAEAARHDRRTEPRTEARTEPEPERATGTAASARPTRTEPEGRTH